MLPKHHRLRKSSDFTAVMRGGSALGARRAGTPRIVVHRGPARLWSPDTHPARVGFVVSGAVGNSVVRHRVTRRLRALMSDRIAACPPGSMLVVRANPAARQATSADLASDLDRVLAKVLA